MADTKRGNHWIHGDSHTPLHSTWSGIISRIDHKGNSSWKNYGKRGIKICDEWRSYINFKNWSLSNGFKEGLTIDRINNNGDYEPNNCRWTTRKVQALNTRNIDNAARYEYKGMLKTVREWSELFGIKRTTLDMRLRDFKWPIEKALRKGAISYS